MVLDLKHYLPSRILKALQRKREIFTQSLLQGIADGTYPFMLLFIYSDDGSSSTVIPILDPLQAPISDARGRPINHAMSHWGDCKPDVDDVIRATYSHSRRFHTEKPCVTTFMHHVVVVCRNYAQPRKAINNLAVGYIYPEKVEAIDNMLWSQIVDIQENLNREKLHR